MWPMSRAKYLPDPQQQQQLKYEVPELTSLLLHNRNYFFVLCIAIIIIIIITFAFWVDTMMSGRKISVKTSRQLGMGEIHIFQFDGSC